MSIRFAANQLFSFKLLAAQKVSIRYAALGLRAFIPDVRSNRGGQPMSPLYSRKIINYCFLESNFNYAYIIVRSSHNKWHLWFSHWQLKNLQCIGRMYIQRCGVEGDLTSDQWSLDQPVVKIFFFSYCFLRKSWKITVCRNECFLVPCCNHGN